MRKILLLIVLLALAFPTPAFTANSIRVFYIGPDGNVRNALALDPSIELVDKPDQADVFVLNGEIHSPAAIRSRVEQGAGLVLILGPGLLADQTNALLHANLNFMPAENALSLNPAPGISDPLIDGITWDSATQIRDRYIVGTAGANSLGFTPLVAGYEDGSLILGSRKIGTGQVYLFTPYLNNANVAFQDWTYFNYFIYSLVYRAAGRTPVSFADYPGSPIPRAQDRTLLLLGLVGLLVLAGGAFVLVRRYSLAHPEALDRAISNRKDFETNQAGTDWEEIGFHRPLGGFFFALFLGMVLFIPAIIYQNLLLPVYILPSAQALGIWGRVTQFFVLVWSFFDMGTSTAFVKFLSQYRVHDPRKSIQYGQVYVWWQALSGAVQVSGMVLLASLVLPQTAFAIYAWSVIIHTFIQIPGFYQVMRNALTGLQRFDFAQVLDMALAALFPMVAQPVFVMLMIAWGKAHPIFGASMGGIMGMGIAAYVSEAATFVLGLLLFRRLGYNARLYFMAHFNWQVIKDSFRFGVFEMLGSAAYGVGQSLEILITQARLINYAEIWGNWMLAQNFVYAFSVINMLYGNLMPAISEAISHGRRILSKYYVAMAYQWGGLTSAFLASVLIAVADRFILGASGPEFVRAASYAVPLLIWGAVQYPSWVGDTVQRGANRPYLFAVLVASEQAIRIGLALVLLPYLQINALIIAYFFGIMIKNVAAFLMNNRLCFPQKFYVWQSLVAPLLAGLAHYALLRWLGGIIWRGDELSSVLMFFVAILPSYPLYAFFYAVFGGWEDATLAEVHRAANLSSFMRPLAWVFWGASSLGARISPLHGRFRIDIRTEALAEAEALTAERVAWMAKNQENPVPLAGQAASKI